MCAVEFIEVPIIGLGGFDRVLSLLEDQRREVLAGNGDFVGDNGEPVNREDVARAIDRVAWQVGGMRDRRERQGVR